MKYVSGAAGAARFAGAVKQGGAPATEAALGA